jgi:hypothetical protein
MQLTLVIPTRNRADLARAALGSVLDQGAGDVRVLVSDNSTDPAERDSLAASTESLEAGDVEYVRPPEPLAMTAHWEWAMGRALAYPGTTHVGFLTDRMVLRHGCLPVLEGLVRRHPGQVITYDHDELLDHSQPIRLLQHEWSGRLLRIKAQHLADLGAHGEFPYCLPRMLNCVVPREVVEAVRERFGSVFDSISPDFCFAFRCIDTVESILFYDAACLVHYSLDRSHGYSYARGSATADRQDFVRELGGVRMNASTPLPDFDGIGNAMFNEYFFVLNDSRSRRLSPPPRHAYLAALAGGLSYIDDPQERELALQRLAREGWRWRGARGRTWLRLHSATARFFFRRPGTFLRRAAGAWRRTAPGRALLRRAVARGAVPPHGVWLEFDTRAEALERARGAPPRPSRDLAHISTLVDPPGVGTVLERDPAA